MCYRIHVRWNTCTLYSHVLYCLCTEFNEKVFPSHPRPQLEALRRLRYVRHMCDCAYYRAHVRLCLLYTALVRTKLVFSFSCSCPYQAVFFSCSCSCSYQVFSSFFLLLCVPSVFFFFLALVRTKLVFFLARVRTKLFSSFSFSCPYQVFFFILLLSVPSFSQPVSQSSLFYHLKAFNSN